MFLISVMFFTLCSACGVSHGQDETQRNRRSIAMMLDRAIKLKEDGTVVAVGGNTNGECNVSDWKDIVDIEANNF